MVLEKLRKNLFRINPQSTIVRKMAERFSSERGSRRRYPELKVGSIVAYSGAFGVEKLDHYGVYLGEGARYAVYRRARCGFVIRGS